MSNAIETQGFKLEIQSGTSPVAWTEVKEIVSFNGFDGAAAEIDVTHLRSTAKEFIMGLQDFGTFTAEINYLPDDAGQVLVRAAKASRDIQHFKITFSDANTATFSGYVTSSPISGGVDAKVNSSFAIRITGDVTFA